MTRACITLMPFSRQYRRTLSAMSLSWSPGRRSIFSTYISTDCSDLRPVRDVLWPRLLLNACVSPSGRHCCCLVAAKLQSPGDCGYSNLVRCSVSSGPASSRNSRWWAPSGSAGVDCIAGPVLGVVCVDGDDVICVVLGITTSASAISLVLVDVVLFCLIGVLCAHVISQSMLSSMAWCVTSLPVSARALFGAVWLLDLTRSPARWPTDREPGLMTPKFAAD